MPHSAPFTELRPRILRSVSDLTIAHPGPHMSAGMGSGIRAFQANRTLLPDGVIGPRTWSTLAGS